MKALIISTSVFPLTTNGIDGYGGTEYLVSKLSQGLGRRGHQVTLVCPEGSKFDYQVEPIFCPLRENEEQTWLRYRSRLESGEFQVIVDATFQKWSLMSSAGRDPALPIMSWFHTSPTIYQSQPPVTYPMWTGVSKSHAQEMSQMWGMPCRYVLNGIDTEFYKALPKPRGERYLAIGRYTPEKGFFEMISAFKRMRRGLDLYGDTEIVGGQDYVKRCMNEADGYFVKANPGISREETVNQMSTHKSLVHFHQWKEPFSLVLIETMATGCVPIASRQGATPELIIDGQTGFIVDRIEDVENLARFDTVRHINLETMRKHVETNFGIERFVSDWETLCQKVIAGERW